MSDVCAVEVLQHNQSPTIAGRSSAAALPGKVGPAHRAGQCFVSQSSRFSQFDSFVGGCVAGLCLFLAAQNGLTTKAIRSFCTGFLGDMTRASTMLPVRCRLRLRLLSFCAQRNARSRLGCACVCH